MKQIHKIITGLFNKPDIAEYKAQKMANTAYYLEQQRKQYIGHTPEGFKTRSSADYFLQ